MACDAEVTAWVTVPDDCAITYTVNGENDIELHFGTVRVGLDMVLSPTAALRLAEVAGRAAGAVPQG